MTTLIWDRKPNSTQSAYLSSEVRLSTHASQSQKTSTSSWSQIIHLLTTLRRLQAPSTWHGVGESFTYLTSQLCIKCQIPSSECLKFCNTWNGFHHAHSHTYKMVHYSFVYSDFGQVSKIYPVQTLVLLTVCAVISSFISDSHKCPFRCVLMLT